MPKAILGGFFILLVTFIVINFFVKIFTKKNTRKRPAEITTVCIIEVGGLILTFLKSVTFLLANPIILLLSLLNLLWIIGLWQMKKWGFVGFLANFVAMVCINLILKNWSALAFSLIFIILLAPVLIYLPESK